MEFENTVNQPIPDYALLKMEVKQQSKSCDIKVKSGKWVSSAHFLRL
jgi:purine-nucleoside phosphorylase